MLSNQSITTPATVIWKPSYDFHKETRLCQGCPSIEKTNKRLWIVWFSGGTMEPDKGNYGILTYSDNDGLN